MMEQLKKLWVVTDTGWCSGTSLVENSLNHLKETTKIAFISACGCADIFFQP